jgi:hypothetical protein
MTSRDMTFANSDGSIRRQDKGTTSSKQQRWPGGRENSSSTSGERRVAEEGRKSSTIGSLGYFMKSSRNPLVNAAAIFVWGRRRTHVSHDEPFICR